MATSLDYFLPHINNPDTKRRLTTYDELIKYLSDMDNSTECDDLGELVDGLNGWIDSSNYKVWHEDNATLDSIFVVYFKGI